LTTGAMLPVSLLISQAIYIRKIRKTLTKLITLNAA
jgi:hypothetical protein